MSSIGGRVALPLFGAYNASKFGLEGRATPCGASCAGHGVDVIVIEPGGVKTRIWDTSNRLADEILAELPPEAERLYGRTIEAVRKQTVRIETESGIEPRVVAEAIGEALTSSRPRARYLVGRDAKLRAGWPPSCPRG